MNLRPLIIDNSIQQQVNDLIAYAEANPFSFDDMLDIQNKAEPPPGDREGFKLEIPYGYLAVFSYELQPAGKCRHLSVSINEPGRLPSPDAMMALIALFRFDSPLEDCKLWVEDFGNGRSAINALEICGN